MNKVEFSNWLDFYWKPIIGYVHRFYYLTHGWVSFHFLTAEDSSVILESLWAVNHGSFVLSRWHPTFDSTTEPITKRHLWLLLPGFPIQWWTKPILIQVANFVGRYVFLDEHTLLSEQKKVAIVLVEFNVSLGLPVELEILCGSKLRIQRLDYRYVPFRCHYCRSTGHLKDRCPNLVDKNIGDESIREPQSTPLKAHEVPRELCSFIELMLLGFISLLLTVGQKPISMICILEKIAYTMLPCTKQKDTGVVQGVKVANDQGEKHSRKLVWESMSSEQEASWRRVLAAVEGGSDHCSSKHGTYPLVSQTGMNQVHIFIFMLAVLHVLYNVFTVALARAKMRSWKAWEKENQTLDYEFSNDPARFRLTHQTSFVRHHMSFWSRAPILKWIVCFFQQFFRSVTKIDYLTLRHGFIVAHLASK